MHPKPGCPQTSLLACGAWVWTMGMEFLCPTQYLNSLCEDIPYLQPHIEQLGNYLMFSLLLWILCFLNVGEDHRCGLTETSYCVQGLGVSISLSLWYWLLVRQSDFFVQGPQNITALPTSQINQEIFTMKDLLCNNNNGICKFQCYYSFMDLGLNLDWWCQLVNINQEIKSICKIILF